MHLPAVVARLVAAQNKFDSEAYTTCFAETAIVHDEGKTHQGKAAIQQWIEHSNQAYRATMKPLTYEENVTGSVLTADVAGNFPGSPATLHFHLTLDKDLITSLKVTG